MQLRLIFQLMVDLHHPLYNRPLAYVHLFTEPVSACPNSQLYKVSKMVHGDGQDLRPLGIVVDAASVARSIHLIPHYGTKVHKCLNAQNALELCESFWVNCFLDKETYQAVY